MKCSRLWIFSLLAVGACGDQGAAPRGEPLPGASSDSTPGGEAAPYVRLPGHVLGMLAQTPKLPASDGAAAEVLWMSIAMRKSDPDGFSAFEASLRDPASPDYHHYLPLNELTQRFGPSLEAYDSVSAYLRSQGFEVEPGTGDRNVVAFHGSRAVVERAFDVKIDDYMRGSQRFHAPDRDPRFPAQLAPLVRSISGLENHARMSPASIGAPTPAAPTSIARAYDNVGFTTENGSGQTIGLIEFSPFCLSDVQNSLQSYGLPTTLANQVTVQQVAGGLTPLNCDPETLPSNDNGVVEAVGDIVTALSVAQGAKIVVFEAPQTASLDTVLAAAGPMVQGGPGYSGIGGVLSDSWAACEDTDPVDVQIQQSVNSLLQTYTAAGLSFFAAAGDQGNACMATSLQGTPYAIPNNVYFPADLPYATGVGGTTLDVNQSTNQYAQEQWFHNGQPCWTQQYGGTCDGGYGTSQVWAVPPWQSAYTSSTMRSVPDIAADADPSTGITLCLGGTSAAPNCTVTFGGTSMATPTWAAIWARVTEELVDQYSGRGIVSAGGGTLYNWASAANVAPFHTPASMQSPGNTFSFLGLGTPDISNLILYASGVPYISSVSPASGLIQGGTTVTVTGNGFTGASFYFGSAEATNVSCSALNGPSQTCTMTAPAATSPGSVTVKGCTRYDGINCSQSAASFDYCEAVRECRRYPSGVFSCEEVMICN